MSTAHSDAHSSALPPAAAEAPLLRLLAANVTFDDLRRACTATQTPHSPSMVAPLWSALTHLRFVAHDDITYLVAGELAYANTRSNVTAPVPSAVEMLANAFILSSTRVRGHAGGMERLAFLRFGQTALAMDDGTALIPRAASVFLASIAAAHRDRLAAEIVMVSLALYLARMDASRLLTSVDSHHAHLPLANMADLCYGRHVEASNLVERATEGMSHIISSLLTLRSELYSGPALFAPSGGNQEEQEPQ